MDIAKKLYGYNPVLFNRGTIGTAILNISDTAQNIDMGVTFDIAYKLDVTSSSTSDAAAGTGARTVEIYGLDFDGNPLSETITMNGNAIVQTANAFWRVFVAKVITAGTGRKNAGDIYIVKTGTGGTYTAGVPGTLTSLIIKILVGLMLGTSGMWTCPRGYTYVMDKIVLCARVQAGRFQLFRAAERAIPATLPYPDIDLDVGVGSGMEFACSAALRINELEDIYFKATMTAAAGIISADGYLRQVNPSRGRY